MSGTEHGGLVQKTRWLARICCCFDESTDMTMCLFDGVAQALVICLTST